MKKVAAKLQVLHGVVAARGVCVLTEAGGQWKEPNSPMRTMGWRNTNYFN